MVVKKSFRKGSKVFVIVGNKKIPGKVEEDQTYLSVNSAKGKTYKTPRKIRQIEVKTSRGNYLVRPSRVKKRFL